MKYFLAIITVDKDTAEKEILNSVFDVEEFDFENKEHIEFLKEYIRTIIDAEEFGITVLNVGEILPEQLELTIDILKEKLEQ